jgi:hypothetical protein
MLGGFGLLVGALIDGMRRTPFLNGAERGFILLLGLGMFVVGALKIY